MRRICLTAWLVCAVAPLARAQDAPADPRCSNQSIVGVLLEGSDACEKVKDLFRYMNPQLGTVIAGGNATLGQGGTLGGPGRFALGFRVNVLQASVPDIQSVPVNTGAAQRSTYETADRPVPMPVLDGAVGVFRGFPLGVTYVGGLDVMVNAAYLPEVSENGVELTTPDGSWKFGIGGRLGIISEGPVTPGLSVTYMRRDLPRVSMTARVDDDEVSMNELDVQTTAWRVVASKSFLVFGLAAGVGQDEYDTSTEITYAVRDGLIVHTPSAPIGLEQSVRRTNFFVDLNANIAVMKLLLEVGRVSGAEVPTFNTLDPEADAARWYGSVGIRVGL
ncbi:MAG: hypothetical protein ACREON_09935 [Gemmatimonadaceae bacterium]